MKEEDEDINIQLTPDEGNPEGIPTEVTKETPNEIPEDVLEETLGKVPGEPPKEAPKEAPKEVPKITKVAKTSSKISIIHVVGVALALCSVVGVFFLVRALQTPETVIVAEDLPEEEEKFLETSTEALFTAETLPRIDASLATQPLMDAFVKNFTGQTTAELGVEYSNTHPGYVKLINNEADLIIVTEPSAEELTLAAEKGIELEVTKVVNEGFAFFVNKDNPVSNVAFDDLAKIYTGEITNWRDLGGNDAEIVAYQRPENSGSQTGLYNLVLKGQAVKIPTIKESVELSMAGIVDYVAAYDNALDAIGYGFYYYVNVMYYNENLKYLAVDGIAPTYQTIQDETYPILSAYYIVTRKGDNNSNVALLRKAMLSRRGQFVASEAGYVPVGK